jgi:hypothetical protein
MKADWTTVAGASEMGEGCGQGCDPSPEPALFFSVRYLNALRSTTAVNHPLAKSYEMVEFRPFVGNGAEERI